MPRTGLTKANATAYASPMRISFSTGTFYHRGLDFSLRLARDAGFDGVEYVLGPDYFLRGAEYLERLVDIYGVPVLSVHPPFTFFSRLPFVPWPRHIGRALPRVTALARQLGADVAVTHTVFLLGAQTPRADRYAQALRLGVAAGGGLALAIESNQHSRRRRRYLLDDLKTLVAFAQRHGCGITFDTCHAGANREDLLASYEIVRPALRNIHLSDVVWRRDKPHTHILPGEGSLPLADFLGRLASDGYDGLITLEVHPRQLSQLSMLQARRQLRRALEFTRASLGMQTHNPAQSSPSLLGLLEASE